MEVAEADLYKITDEDIHYCAWLARKMYQTKHSRLPDEDEMQDAMEGMCIAAETFKEGKGAKFISWARWHMFQKMTYKKPGALRPNGLPVKADMYLMRDSFPYVDETVKKTKTLLEEEIINGITISEILPMLPPKLRDATIRHYFEGEEYKDMAKELGYSNNSSLSSVLGQWRKKIREQLGGDDD